MSENIDSVLHCANIYKAFQDGKQELVVLHGVNLNLLRGQQIAIMGRSGSGKSTLLQILGGLDDPTRGKVSIMGKDLSMLSQNQRGILRNQYVGFVYQMHHLLPEFSALENVALPLLISGISAAKAQQRGMELLDMVGLAARSKHTPGKLSGGERQRVAIARSLVTNPACILADEPTGNLDDENAAQVMNMLRQLNRHFKTSLVIVTHDQQIAQQVDQIYQLHSGSLALL